MILALLLFFQSGVAVEYDGAEIFAKSCATAYCHGPAGTAGRAQAIAGRNFEPAALRRTIVDGIPSKGMPEFEKLLNAAQIDAVVAYVRMLRGPAPAPTPQPPVKLTPELAEGRDLFFDTTRMPSCSSCHSVGTRGSEMAAKLTANSSLEDVQTPRVQTAIVDGDSFPAIVESTPNGSIRLWDLKSPLPLIRAFPASAVRLTQGTKWSHADQVARYTQAEIDSILAYFRATAP